MTITDGYQPLPQTDLAEPYRDYGHGLDTETDDQVDEDTTSDETGADETSKTRGRGRTARAGAKVTARTVRAILAKHAELAAASADDIALLAATLGVKDNVDDLVAHILSTPRLTLSGVTELDAIVQAARIDPFDAVAVAMQHEAQAKAVWGILSGVGLLDGPRPSKDGDASVAIARAAGKFGPEHEQRLTAVKDLARKGN
ncbi:MAG: hypothetical protein J0J04_07725 [Microbacterium sp.]|uniref:hypothetical protein n=1 Tax=Microbacterium sp. TaxID=51671 RepID=UPI001AD510B0|nr:hypothetical protein [Microbacterium sp.]MBN9214687.1 hypothetical protein [Microbacterium sp.]